MIKNILKNEKGFTLVEMLIVLAVISILVLLMIPNAMSILGTANEQGCQALNSSSNALTIANELTGDNASIPQDAFDRVCD
jgi:competence protein ComGC